MTKKENTMRVKVERIWPGDKWQLSFAHNGREAHEYVRAEQWTRKQSTEALNLLESVYGVNRRNIKFDIH